MNALPNRNQNGETSSGGGIGFGGALALLFIGLKLGHVIAWPWFWVLCPFWIPLAILAVVLLCILIADAVA